uniref:UDP-N-acetylglucosamine transferase subunit ALG14 n=1 Tax=Meloidogyne hapla TaxID=6305 RepID=A0A1I8BTU1_MELHA
MFDDFTFLQFLSLFITSLLILNISLFVLNVSLRLWKGKENKDTTEMLKLLDSTIQNNLFSERIYVMADSDKLSDTKVFDFENQIENNKFIIYKIPRARNVGQSFFSSIPTTLIASWHSAKLLWITRPDLILCNGPAISLPICLFARLFNLLKIKRIKIIFAESICRVQTLSLTGRILYNLRIPDAFLVQWPSLKEKYNKAQFIGRLV